MKKEVKFIINRSELTAGTRGAGLGPDAIFTAARAKENHFFADFERIELPNYNALLDQAVEDRYAKRIDGLIEVYEDVAEAMNECFEENKFPFVIAGDHGSAGGTIAGIKMHYPDKRLGVIWIDAHGDLHTPYTTPSGNLHGMPLAAALGEDNLPCKRNDVPQSTIDKWNNLKSIGGEGKLLPEDLVFIGVRDTEPEEDALMERYKIKNFTVDEVNKHGAKKTLEAVFDRLSNCDVLYVSFDVDSMDPEMTSYGTGTPVKDGLSPEVALELLKGLLASQKIVSMEFVEVNPCLDEKKNKMAETAFDMIEKLLKN